MEIVVSARPLMEAGGDVVVVERYEGEGGLAAEAQRVDRALDGLLSRALAEERFEGRIGETTHLHAAGRLAATRVLVVGMGSRAECAAETVRRAASAALRRARDLGARSVATNLLGTRLPARVRAEALVEGALLGLYAFDRYKAPKGEERAVETLMVRVPERDQAAVRQGVRVAELDRKSTRLNSSHIQKSRMPSSA